MSDKWEEIFTPEQIKKIQKIQIKNLLELKRVCSILSIDFFLYGGSMLGAVKYKGFVPWDDDLDIAMMRADYMKFIKEAPKYLSQEFCLQSPYNDKKTPYFFTKLRFKGTKFIEYGNHKLNIEQGIYVDIYPIDNLPDDQNEFLRLFNKYQKSIKWYTRRQCPYLFEPPKGFGKKVKGAFKKVLWLLLNIMPHKYFVKKIDEIMTKYNDKQTSRFGNYSFLAPVNFLTEVYPLEKVKFENIEVNIPKGWDEHLKLRYGDNYMNELPPEDKRYGHKPYIFDLGEFGNVD